MDNSTRPQKIKHRLLIVGQILLSVLAIWLAIWQISTYTDSINFAKTTFSPMMLLGSFFLYILFYAVLSVHWQYVCRAIDPKVSPRQWVAFWASQPYKYLPSSIFTFTFRAKYSKQLGMSYKKSSIAQLVENYNMITSAMIIAVGSWLWMHGYLWLTGAVVAIGLISYVLLFDITNIRKRRHIINIKTRITMFLFASIAWVVAGIGFLLMIYAIDGNGDALMATASNAAAFGSGILAIFAPGGMGIREYVYGLFGVSALVIIGWRSLTALVDILSGIFGWIMIRKLSDK